MRFFYGTAATLQCRLTSVRVRGFRMIVVARRNCPVKPRGSTAVTRTRHYCAAKRHTRLAPATNLATPTTRKNLQARSAGKCKSPQRIYANADFCIGEECEAFANSTQCHCGGAAIPKEKMRCYRNAPQGRSFRWAPFWRFNAARRGTVSFLYASGKRTQAARAPKRKETPPLLAGVRCIGRSYRNRTYTMGVRGPCATTTPSSNALVRSVRERAFPSGAFVIIAHIFAFCNRFRQQY